jgi:hypothetical protein
MSSDEIATFSERLDRSERENRRWRLLSLCSTLTVGCFLLTGAASPGGRVVDTQALILRDGTGRIRAILGSANTYLDVPSPQDLPGPGEYGLHIYSSDGRYLAGLAEVEDASGSQLALLAGKTPTKAGLLASDGLASLDLAATEQLREVAGREHAEWRKKFNAATVAQRYKMGVSPPYPGVTADISAFAKGQSSLSLRGSPSRSKEGLEFSLFQGHSRLSLMDDGGRDRIVLGNTAIERKASGVLEELPTSSIVLFDKRGRVSWKTP